MGRQMGTKQHKGGRQTAGYNVASGHVAEFQTSFYVEIESVNITSLVVTDASGRVYEPYMLVGFDERISPPMLIVHKDLPLSHTIPPSTVRIPVPCIGKLLRSGDNVRDPQSGHVSSDRTIPVNPLTRFDIATLVSLPRTEREEGAPVPSSRESRRDDTVTVSDSDDDNVVDIQSPPLATTTTAIEISNGDRYEKMDPLDRSRFSIHHDARIMIYVYAMMSGLDGVPAYQRISQVSVPLQPIWDNIVHGHSDGFNARTILRNKFNEVVMETVLRFESRNAFSLREKFRNGTLLPEDHQRPLALERLVFEPRLDAAHMQNIASNADRSAKLVQEYATSWMRYWRSTFQSRWINTSDIFVLYDFNFARRRLLASFLHFRLPFANENYWLRIFRASLLRAYIERRPSGTAFSNMAAPTSDGTGSDATGTHGAILGPRAVWDDLMRYYRTECDATDCAAIAVDMLTLASTSSIYMMDHVMGRNKGDKHRHMDDFFEICEGAGDCEDSTRDIYGKYLSLLNTPGGGASYTFGPLEDMRQLLMRYIPMGVLCSVTTGSIVEADSGDSDAIGAHMTVALALKKWVFDDPDPQSGGPVRGRGVGKIIPCAATIPDDNAAIMARLAKLASHERETGALDDIFRGGVLPNLLIAEGTGSFNPMGEEDRQRTAHTIVKDTLVRHDRDTRTRMKMARARGPGEIGGKIDSSGGGGGARHASPGGAGGAAWETRRPTAARISIRREQVKAEEVPFDADSSGGALVAPLLRPYMFARIYHPLRGKVSPFFRQFMVGVTNYFISHPTVPTNIPSVTFTYDGRFALDVLHERSDGLKLVRNRRNGPGGPGGASLIYGVRYSDLVRSDGRVRLMANLPFPHEQLYRNLIDRESKARLRMSPTWITPIGNDRLAYATRYRTSKRTDLTSDGGSAAVPNVNPPNISDVEHDTIAKVLARDGNIQMGLPNDGLEKTFQMASVGGYGTVVYYCIRPIMMRRIVGEFAKWARGNSSRVRICFVHREKIAPHIENYVVAIAVRE